jgi:hypothetical protein
MFIIVNCNDRSLTQNTRIILRDRKSVSSHQVIVASTSHEQLCVATWSYLEMHVHRYNKGRHSWMSPLVSGWETWLKPSQVDGFSCINASFQRQSSNAKFNFQVQLNWPKQLTPTWRFNHSIPAFLGLSHRSACRSRGSTAFNCGRLRSLLHFAQACGTSCIGMIHVTMTTQGSAMASMATI